MSGRRLGLVGGLLALIGVVLIGAGVVLAANPLNGSGWFGSMMGGSAYGPGGMMGGWTRTTSDSPGPGDAGFIVGTASAPRVVRILALPTLRFSPDSLRVKAGETVQFQVTTMGPAVHEFMVGPAADVAADREGTPEIADIGMMQTKRITYTFSGSGPYAFACHAPGHYDAGMSGTIVVVD